MRRSFPLVGVFAFHLANAQASVPEPAVAVDDDVARFAVVVGKNEPESLDRAILRYADDDAIAMHELFEEAGVRSVLLVSPDADTASLRRIADTETLGGFPNLPATVRAERSSSAPHATRPEKPTLAAVLRAFDQLSKEIQAAKNSGKRTELTLFYSGHGDVSDGEGFVVLDGGRLTRTVLLEKIIARSSADTNHVIIDACKSYYMVFDKGPGGERRPFYRSFAAAGAGSGFGKNLQRTGFVLSSSSDEESHEWERYQAGVFSYEVRSALRGGADANLDGRITYGELGAFVTTANRGISNPKFRPDFLVSPPGKTRSNLTDSLLRWRDQPGSLTVDASAAGHYYIETESGIRIADVHPKNAQQLTVHLPKSRPLFVRRADDRTEGVLSTGEPILLSALAMQPTAVARKGALSIAFESLFSTPFGIDVVRAYDTLYTEKAASLSAQPEPNAGRHMQLAQHILLGAGAGALVAGGTLSILALSVRRDAKTAPQSEIPSMNRTIGRYNTAAIALYGVAAASGISWLALRLLSARKAEREMTLFPIVTPTELSLGLATSWGD